MIDDNEVAKTIIRCVYILLNLKTWVLCVS